MRVTLLALVLALLLAGCVDLQTTPTPTPCTDPARCRDGLPIIRSGHDDPAPDALPQPAYTPHTDPAPVERARTADVPNHDAELAYLRAALAQANRTNQELRHQRDTSNFVLNLTVDTLQAHTGDLVTVNLRGTTATEVGYDSVRFSLDSPNGGLTPEGLTRPAVFYDDGVLQSYFLSCKSHSMRPTIECGDVALVQRVTPTVRDALRIGDVVSYNMTSETTCDPTWTGHIVHRIVGWDVVAGKTYARMKGDDNANEDPCGVPFSLIDYKVLAVVYGADRNTD